MKLSERKALASHDQLPDGDGCGGPLKRARKPRVRFEIKPLYRVSELAEIVGMSKWAMARLLRRHGVDVTMGGRGQPAMVTLIAIRVGLPDVWESILLAKAMQ